MVVEFENLPDIKFDLSFLFEAPPAGLVAASADDTYSEALLQPIAMEYDGPLPDIQFDLSFLQPEADMSAPAMEQTPERAIAAEATASEPAGARTAVAVLAPPRPSRETLLEAWFRERALELARHAEQREAIGHAAA